MFVYNKGYRYMKQFFKYHNNRVIVNLILIQFLIKVFLVVLI